MTASYMQLPADGSGKKVRSRSLIIGSDTVHEQYVQALTHTRKVNTRYWYNTGSLVVAASADGANVGRVYIENDPDSAVLLAITFARFRSQHASVLATPTAPRIALRRFTFTGSSPSGSALTGAKQDSSLANKDGNWDVRTAATGMTITEGADIAAFYPVAALTAVGGCPPAADAWLPEPDRPLVLRAGEGLMVKQADAATASDTRVFTITFEIEEFTEV